MLNKLYKAGLNLNRGFTHFEKPKVDIVKLYEKLTGNEIKKKTGRALMCLCCFHQESTPSMALYPDTNSFYCFACSKGGDYIKFVMEKENLDYKEALLVIKEYEY